MSLGPDGGDPDGIKLRAAEGFEAIDYFVATYWVFAKAVQALADIGYDSSSMRPVCVMMCIGGGVLRGCVRV
jgi:phospholipid:diacylglycerol acyltransferase